MDEQAAGTATQGTTWQGMPCAKGLRVLLDATLERASEDLLDKFSIRPGTLSAVVEEQQRRNLERQRAMLLCHVDEIEQQLGYDSDPATPRTSQIRNFWKDSGRPALR